MPTATPTAPVTMPRRLIVLLMAAVGVLSLAGAAAAGTHAPTAPVSAVRA